MARYFSLTAKKAPQAKTAYSEGVIEPADGQAIEIRFNLDHFVNRLDADTTLIKLLQRMRERGKPSSFRPRLSG